MYPLRLNVFALQSSSDVCALAAVMIAFEFLSYSSVRIPSRSLHPSLCFGHLPLGLISNQVMSFSGECVGPHHHHHPTNQPPLPLRPSHLISSRSSSAGLCLFGPFVFLTHTRLTHEPTGHEGGAHPNFLGGTRQGTGAMGSQEAWVRRRRARAAAPSDRRSQIVDDAHREKVNHDVAGEASPCRCLCITHKHTHSTRANNAASKRGGLVDEKKRYENKNRPPPSHTHPGKRLILKSIKSKTDRIK